MTGSSIDNNDGNTLDSSPTSGTSGSSPTSGTSGISQVDDTVDTVDGVDGGGMVNAVDSRAQRLIDRARQNGWPLPSGGSRSEVLQWLAEPGPRDPSRVPRYLCELWRERADLHETFPGIPFDASQRDDFLRWAQTFAAAESNVPPELLDYEVGGSASGAPAPYADGNAESTAAITVVGFLRAQLGLATAGRRMVALCRMTGERVQAIPYDHVAGALRIDWPDVALEDIHPTDITVLCVNGTELPRLSRALGPRILGPTHRIGLWFWELDTLSDAMAVGLGHLDELWVTSSFVAEALRRSMNDRGLILPVHVVPLGIDTGVPHGAARDDDGTSVPGLPGGVVIGCAFDYASTIRRKNPLGVIEAFRAAFPVPFELGHADGPRLVLKTHGSREFDASRAIVADAASGRPDIVVIDENFTEAQQHRFYRRLSAYVSLHRSEGYGLGPLEAMANAVPTIATAYSGNLEFMNDANSWLVPAGRSTVPPDTPPYQEGATWAEPDIAAAAKAMRNVVVDRLSPAVLARARRGQIDVEPLVSGETGAAWIRARVAGIRSARTHRSSTGDRAQEPPRS